MNQPCSLARIPSESQKDFLFRRVSLDAPFSLRLFAVLGGRQAASAWTFCIIVQLGKGSQTVGTSGGGCRQRAMARLDEGRTVATWPQSRPSPDPRWAGLLQTVSEEGEEGKVKKGNG